MKDCVVSFTWVAGVAIVSSAVHAQYPVRPIRMVVPFSAGSTTDVIARILAQPMQQALGQTFVIGNRPGADGMLAGDMVVRAPADGYTLLMATNSPLSAVPHLRKNMPYDALNSIQHRGRASASRPLACAGAGIESTQPVVARCADGGGVGSAQVFDYAVVRCVCAGENALAGGGAPESRNGGNTKTPRHPRATRSAGVCAGEFHAAMAGYLGQGSIPHLGDGDARSGDTAGVAVHAARRIDASRVCKRSACLMPGRQSVCRLPTWLAPWPAPSAWRSPALSLQRGKPRPGYRPVRAESSPASAPARCPRF